MNWVPLKDVSDLPVRMDPRPMFPKSFHPVHPDILPDYSGYAPYLSRNQCAPTYYFSDLYWSQVGDVKLTKYPVVPPTRMSAVTISELAAVDILMAGESLSIAQKVGVL